MTNGNGNHPPTIQPLDDQTVPWGETVSFTVYAYDPDGDDLALEQTLGPGTLSGDTFTWDTVAADANTMRTVRFRATDSGGLFDVAQCCITVTNQPPQFEGVSRQTFPWGTPISVPVSATDPDPYDSVNIVKTKGPGTCSGSDFTWQPGPGDVGEHVVELKAFDDVGASDTLEFVVEITNTAPTLDNPGGQTTSWCDSVSIGLTASDPDPQDELTFSKIAGPGSVSGSEYTYDPSPADVGVHTIKFRVTDLVGEFDEIAIQVHVTNQSPILSDPGNQSIRHQETLSLQLYAYDGDSCDTLVFTKVSGPGDLSGDYYTWTPTALDIGQHTAVFRVTDEAGACDEVMVEIHVENTPPTLTSPGNWSSPWGVPISFTLVASDPDPSDQLTFTKPLGPGTLDSYGGYEWTPDSQDVDDHDVTFRVTDMANAFDETTIRITVTNDPPTIAPIGNVVVTAGDLVSFQVVASDTDPYDTVTVSQDSGPGSVDSYGYFEWQTSSGDEGTHLLVFRATDLCNASTTAVCVVTVEEP